MDVRLASATLKDGTAAEVRLVMPPEPTWAERVDRFLGHKGLPWQIHWRLAFDGRCDDLETRFYLLLVDGRPVSNIMTVEADGIGILGHVYTLPEWRGRGAASILMKAATGDFAARDGIALYLYTEHDSMPWHLYRRFGFEGLLPGRGFMSWIRRPDSLRERFAGTGLRARPTRWRDWPLVQCLFLQPAGDDVRNVTLKRFGICDMEGSFLTLQQRMAREPGVRSAVLTNTAGMAVGFATAVPLDTELTDYVLVDLFAHPNAEAGLDALLAALELPAGRPALAVIDEPSTARRRALEEAGFRHAGRLPAALNVDDHKGDLHLFVWIGDAAAHPAQLAEQTHAQ